MLHSGCYSSLMVSPRRAQTRRKLVRAATVEVARSGFHAASVEAIARRAGFSVGALYSNFDGKDDLFFAVFDGHIAWFEEHLERVAEAADTSAAAGAWMAELGRDPEQFLVFVEFWAYAVRRAKLRLGLADRLAEMRRQVGQVFGDDGVGLLALAAARGLAIEKLTEPDAVPDETVDMLAAFAAASPGSGTPDRRAATGSASVALVEAVGDPRDDGGDDDGPDGR